MCGIFASVGEAPDEARLDLVAHRGPDGRGWRVFESRSGPVALGHRRLSILDTSDAGLQPMEDASGRFVVTYNGEIYNFLELRRELEAKGERFRTATDTEVLLALFRREGLAMLPRLRGMFAFVVFDRARGELTAARDAFGIKPLYVAETSRGIAFASEIKQLLGLPGVPARMNLARAGDFLAAGLLDHTEDTLFHGVRQLRGGEAMVVQTEGARAAARRLAWAPPRAPAIRAMRFEEAARAYREALEESVALHLRSDVRVGSCLSGGLDSSSIVALMAERGPVEAVSAVYPGEDVDESRHIEAVLAQTGARSHRVEPQPEDVADRLDRITWHQDEPFGSTSIVAQHCVFGAARAAGLTVMLDGQGADEPLGGYANAWPLHHASLLREGRVGAFARALRARRANGASPVLDAAQAALALLPASVRNAAADTRARVGGAPRWLRAEALGEASHRAREDAAVAALGLPPARDLATLGPAMTFVTNLPMLLHWEDRNSMAHSVEARVPFLDGPLVKLALSLPAGHRMCPGEPKRVLRAAMKTRLPRSVLERRDKIGFATPEQAWLAGPLRPLVRDGVEDCLSLHPELFEGTGLRALLARGDREGRMPPALWRAVSFARWSRVFGVAS